MAEAKYPLGTRNNVKGHFPAGYVKIILKIHVF